MLLTPTHKKLALVFCLLLTLSKSFSQCPETLLDEDFNTDPVIGPVLANIYGDGNYNGASYTYDGTYYGWFNVRNGFSDVDVYVRDFVSCIGAEISISILMRETWGGTNIDLIAEDDFGVEIASSNITLTGGYTLYTLDFTLATTAGFSFIIHCNTTGGAGVDICAEDLLITADDNVLPTASNPAPIIVECAADVPAADITVVTDEDDNCSVPTVAFVSDVSDGATCPETITRTYSVTDDCDNSINVTQTITVNDVTDPTASNPAPINVECIADVPDPDITVVTDEADNCSVPTVAFVSDVSDGATCPETITRTYSVTDDCDNSINVTQTITVNDVTDPTASNPAPINVECAADVPAADITVVTDEADNCSVPTVAFVSDVSDGATCPETITRTYSVTDDCGNSINVTQTITVNDITDPTASNPAPISVECAADVPAADITVVTDEDDNCSVPTVAFVSDVSDGATCPETITRTYSVTDDCGNSINVTQTITVNDITDPTASNPAPISVECAADVPAADITVVTDEDDNCSVPTVAFVSDVSDGATCPETITRTYSVTDDCGNSINVTQTITVNDITDPTASNPAPINVECAADVPAADITVVTDEDDNCSVPTVAFVSDVSDGATCPETITRTYSVTDDCGNSINVTQTITINDITDPTASNPAPINVECAADVPAADITVVTDEDDNCSVPTVAFVSDVSDGATCPETITRTYSVTDDCGNSINVTQTITINDITDPTASNPAPINVECATDVPAADITVVTDETDNCSVPTVAFVSDVSDGATCPETITRTYSVTDDCGNSINVTQTITINDVTDPTASNPAPINVECAADIPAADITVVTDEDDNCSVPTVAFVSDVSDGATCPETITRTYSVTDDCGNSINVTQTITVEDVTDPTASNPAPLNVECIADVPAADITVVTDEDDNCSVPTVAFVSDVSDGATCPETITRTYSVTDDCGNSINVTQTITVEDVTDPTASNPVPINVECAADVPAADITVVTDEDDNCSVPTVAFVSDVSDGATCPETITRTYSVTDDCGNSINVTQTITVNDITDPTASNPDPINVECIGDVPAADITVVSDEDDNCSVPTVAFVSDVSDGATCPETITRTYSVTDDCGNSINVTQTITINDITDPTASNPAPINVECAADVPAADITVVTDEDDNCSIPTVAFVSDVSDGATCPETITRTYSVTDDCGNSINVTQTITVNDVTDPTASNPAPINVECAADVPAADITVVTDESDNCSVPTVAFVSDVSDGATCPETITRTYSVTDDCGNSINITQTITVNDITDPTASNPAPINVECIGDVPAADITVVTDEDDNCSVPTVAFVSDVSDGATCPETITRTYSVTDDCGNSINVTQTITVNDITDPTASNPAPINVECIEDVPAADITVVTDEADNCSVPTVAFVSDVSDGATCPETITRTYSVTDDCGNSINVTQTITVNDITDPTASDPADIVIPGGTAPDPDVTVVTDEADNCSVPIVAFVSDVSDGGVCPETITRTYSVTDDCGNSINVTQLIIITDPIMPTASDPAPIDVECIADVPAPDITVVTDEDDNMGPPTVAFVSDVSDGATCPETITRTYSVTDICGNSIDVTQTITVNDVTDPTASNPAPINVECAADVPAADITVVTDEADNCSVPTVAFVSDVSDGATCPETITRTYSVTDDCGNSINVTQTITINDVTDPTASNPAPINVECAADVPAADITVVTDEADNCSVPTVAFVSDISDGATCPETITRTYSVTDDCGNSINVTQTITVNDITDPTASNPAPINVECAADVPAADITVVTDETDNCSVPTVAFVSDVSDGATCPETITRTYSVTDDCGNSINVTQTITVNDITDPTASNPAPINVECIADVPAADITVVTDETDNCSVPTVAFVSDVSDGTTCPETITRTYSVTDDCGNSINVTQTITVNDVTDPTASNPAPINVECVADVPAADIAVVTDEADNCSVPTVAFVSDVSDGATCPETITRTYSVTDDCGNSINVTQTITVNDVTDPTASNPAPVNVECIADVPAADITVVTDEADNCSVPTVAFVSDVSDGATCPETITRTYSVTDDCGNSINVTQTITVNDITDPTASDPTDIVIPGGTAPAPDITVVVDEDDNCSVPTVAFVSDVSDGELCPETITRTYSVTDDCGNSINVTQLIIITDPIMPTASDPAPINVECIADVPAPDITVVTDEDDNIGIPTVAFVSDVSDGATCPETITRTYSVTDDCGNSINVTQTITVNDVTDPTASNPAPINVECAADVPAADITVVTDETDNCSVPTVAFVSDVSDGATCPETITRTYSVTDDCGNSINVTQTITVNDVTDPTASNPAPINVECAADVPAADITVVTDATDNCSVPTVVFVSDVSDGATCPETITRTYSVTDDCGNSINVTQTITVNDITDPTASNPTPINVECAADVPAADISVVTDEDDNCSVPTVAFVSDVSDGATCPETITRTYSVTDDCGNSIDVTQTITVNDVTDPTASNPAPINVECAADVPAADIAVVTDETDNCSVPTVAFVSDVSDGAACPETITRTYSVTDDCGNSINVTQTITVNDITDPTASNPAPINVECAADVPAADITVVTDEMDNCSVPTVAFVSDVSDGATCPETITRTYSVTDDCGNSINVTQTITVNDITDPTASNPDPINVECAADVPAADITVVIDEDDNCSVPTVAFVSDVSDGATCPETITRTYSVTDDCGNSINVTQTITVNDVTDPTASNPAPINVECAADVPAADITVVTDETDNCSVPTVAFVSDVSDGASCPETITRTYSVTDDCGNSINVIQTITINDVTAPTASNPAPITVNCASDVPLPDPEVVTDELDNCSVPTVTFVSDLSDGEVCNYETITRTYAITDDCGNTATVTQTITINATTPTVDAGPGIEICEGTPIVLIADNPDDAEITWAPYIEDGTSFIPEVGTTVYTSTASVCSGECTFSDDVTVVVHPNPVVLFTGDDLLGCVTHTVTFTNESLYSDDCYWEFGDGNVSTSCATVTNTYDEPGLYDVTLTATSSEGCTTSETYEDYVEVLPQPIAAFSFTPTEISVSNGEINFTNESLYATYYTWDFGDGSPESNEIHPDHFYSDYAEGSYTITLEASNDAECVSYAEATIQVLDELIFFVPNVFTPDGNDFNENFKPVFAAGLDIYDYHLTIFNRWGEIVFESYDVNYGWDGAYGNMGLVQDGVYVWQLDFGTTMSDKRHTEIGSVTVLK